jgi:uncharacterized protein
MKIRLEDGAGGNFIRAYGPGQITVNHTVYTRSLIVTPEKIIPDWPPSTFIELERAHFEGIAALRPEVVILGAGGRLQFPAPACLQELVRARIGVEVMDTGAACRTFNILMGENRRVVAALLMIERQGL